MASEPLTELEEAIETIKETYHTYTVVGDRGYHLNFKVFKKLVTQELPHFLKCSRACEDNVKLPSIPCEYSLRKGLLQQR
nr:protein S100-A13-like [Meriones unguiculatus]